MYFLLDKKEYIFVGMLRNLVCVCVSVWVCVCVCECVRVCVWERERECERGEKGYKLNKVIAVMSEASLVKWKTFNIYFCTTKCDTSLSFFIAHTNKK